MGIIDRILTIVITATLTSAVWIVAGGSLIELASDKKGEDSMRPAEAAPSPSPTDGTADVPPNGDGSETVLADALHTDGSTTGESGDAGLRVPVLNVRASDLTDTFMDERGGGGRLHEAIDIMAPEGTSVVAAAPGTVEKLFVSEAGGNTIYIRSQDRRTIHYYAHLAEYAEGLKEGQRVRRGQRLGTVGSTGNASPEAPHLHFAILRTTADAEWWEPANALNPYLLLTK
ncbi:M23 family metallopeptidase [Altererythrobacter arenosus]|uniref:M23 family metallopeptidase n=1 Tax=Altererythrobacter arenosus TaxID=3032592 RepID=A0ABY8FPG2_9SPHN|nr:M23 family metallopeptidase [Altererythrobacter sp. CAU 1644]WFL76890.1 M23 family metallopeptidase [Altererythrobacter sp. CAU 1644]